ncbi:MAG TPA: hypothetical protein VHS79_24080 [Actinomycetes bacterium]|nr:hypothetical protein [Actinomycetes bacterium]
MEDAVVPPATPAPAVVLAMGTARAAVVVVGSLVVVVGWLVVVVGWLVVVVGWLVVVGWTVVVVGSALVVVASIVVVVGDAADALPDAGSTSVVIEPTTASAPSVVLGDRYKMLISCHMGAARSRRAHSGDEGRAPRGDARLGQWGTREPQREF